MSSENFKYVLEKEKLPDLANNSTCVFCNEEITDFETGCVICNNGHRGHKDCWDKYGNFRCRSCGSAIEKMCHGYNPRLEKHAYSYYSATGGNYKKYKILKTSKRKYSSKSLKKIENLLTKIKKIIEQDITKRSKK